MSNEEIVIELRTCRDPHRRQELLTDLYSINKGFICKLAKMYSGSQGWEFRENEHACSQQDLMYQDLCQVAYFGLSEAAERWDESKEVNFLSYAAWWIKKEMVRHIENNGYVIRIPSGLHRILGKLSKLTEDYQKEYGRDPSSAEICRKLNITMSQAQCLKNALPCLEVDSLDADVNEDIDNEKIGYVTDGRDYAEEVEDAIDNEALAMKLWSVVDGLKSSKRSYVLHEYYEDDKKLREIALDMGCSYQAVQENLKRGLADLRKKSNIQSLRHYIDADAYSLGLRDTGYAPFIHSGTSSTEKAAIKLAGL